ncbi:hypothetical protein [Sorangium sp. So ce1182]|uniref:GAP1-N1 domain-containing protein n=1 Tax=Sorangium sp. So ce1182 TaxID=3133334 RepID=UPI003F635795
MASTCVHQAIHGYRDGHRLLSSSLSLGADASRAMLVLSDMSGPSMHPGFDEYLTGYPLPGTDLFVFAKTWYAPEMQRPGCVWTHSLLIPRTHISRVSTPSLLPSLRRPQVEGLENAATAPIVLEHEPSPLAPEGFENNAVAATLMSAVLGQARPVVVGVDTAAQLESVFLRIWEELWSGAKARFAFCTGSLMPRSVGGALMDLQAVPRAIPSSQFRKSAGAALMLDLRSPGTPEPWVEQVLQGAARGEATFRSWMESAAGAEAARGAAPGLVKIFGQWYQPNWSARSILASAVDVPELEPVTRVRLLGMVLDRAGAEEGARGRRELLQELCGRRNTDLSSMTSLLEEQTRRLFEESRAEACSLALSLLGAELTEVGEHVLRAAVLSLTPSDLDTFGDAQAPFLPTIVGANPALATAPGLWRRAGSRGHEILAQLDAEELAQERRHAVVDAVLASGREAPVEALVGFAGSIAVSRVLSALAAGNLFFSPQWRSSLSSRPDAVLEWLEGQSALSPRELEVASQFVSPKCSPQRLTKMWQSGIAASEASITPRVAAFGLALALSERTCSPLLATCFQPTFDELADGRIEYEAWDWLRELAPPVFWWRDWDRCERIAAALARLLERQDASLKTVFSILRSRWAILKVASVLDDDRHFRQYLKALRKASVASPSIGTREQRDALLEGW